MCPLLFHLLIWGALSVSVHRHENALLAPSLLQTTLTTQDASSAAPIVCNYQTDNSGSSTYCPTGCVPSDVNPTYPAIHYEATGLCPQFTTYEACPTITICGPSDWPAECQVAWSAWSTCDATCGGGQMKRTRSLPIQCMSCHYCDTEYQSCNTQPCGRDCQLGNWTDWSPCSISCIPVNPVAATQTRTRSVVQGLQPGLICDPSSLIQVQSCTPSPPQCSVDCQVSNWTAWTPCSQSCGCGVQTQTRTVVVQPQGYGAPCPLLTQTQKCSCGECPQPCLYSEWNWGSCTGDCYDNITLSDGSFDIEYPQRRGVRYIIQQAAGGMPPCDSPCALAQNQDCTNVPPCSSSCVTTPWGNWTGDCPACLTSGQPVPTQIRERSITSMGDGICGCTRQERVCDIPWCTQDCILSNWTDWSPCIPNSACSSGSQSGIETRTRTVLRPNNVGGQACGSLIDTQPCSICCPVDCVVGSWTGWLSTTNQCGQLVNGVPTQITCGTTPGQIVYHRTITQQPNSCGAPCPATQQTVECYPPNSCCPVNCTLGVPVYSDCYGCGNNARRWKKKVVINYESCGGTPCCYYGGCSLFTPDTCDNPPLCPQTPCTFGEWGNYSACNASCTSAGDVPTQCRTRALIYQPPGETCPGSLVDCQACNTQCCPVNCEVGDWGPWGDWSPSCGQQVRSRSRPITQNPSCGGSPCPPLTNHDTQTTCCPVDCVVDAWGPWTLCPSCLPSDGTQTNQTQKRAILVQPSCGGANCPTPLSNTQACPTNPCDRDCDVGPWSNWGPCNAGCGDGFQVRTRNITVSPLGFGMACPPLIETQYCNVKCPTCVKGSLQYGPCTPTCTNDPTKTGFRTVSQNTQPLYIDNGPGQNATLVDMCPPYSTVEPCSIPCCPVDCTVSPWTTWGDCIDGVRIRTRTVATHASCNGAPCPSCLLERDVCQSPTPPPTECDFGEACDDGIGSS